MKVHKRRVKLLFESLAYVYLAYLFLLAFNSNIVTFLGLSASSEAFYLRTSLIVFAVIVAVFIAAILWTTKNMIKLKFSAQH